MKLSPAQLRALRGLHSDATGADGRRPFLHLESGACVHYGNTTIPALLQRGLIVTRRDDHGASRVSLTAAGYDAIGVQS